MTITATKNNSFEFVKFKWNDELDSYETVTAGIEFEEVDDLLDRMELVGTHEGNDYPGWNVEVKL